MFQDDLEFRLRYYLQLKMKEKKAEGEKNYGEVTRKSTVVGCCAYLSESLIIDKNLKLFPR